MAGGADGPVCGSFDTGTPSRPIGQLTAVPEVTGQLTAVREVTGQLTHCQVTGNTEPDQVGPGLAIRL